MVRPPSHGESQHLSAASSMSALAPLTDLTDLGWGIGHSRCLCYALPSGTLSTQSTIPSCFGNPHPSAVMLLCGYRAIFLSSHKRSASPANHDSCACSVQDSIFG